MTSTVNTSVDKSTVAGWHGRLRERFGGRWLLAAAAPAGLVTAGLFGLMTGLIQVDEVTLEEPETRVLKPFVPQTRPPEKPDTDREPPIRPEDVPTPPPPPKMSNVPSDAGLPPITLAGHVPDTIPVGSIVPILTGPQPIGDRVATPVRAPLPDYPQSALTRNLEGDCKVRFSISPRGIPFNIEASCTDRAFESEARRSVGRAEFLPQIVNGQPVESHGAIYPLAFRLNSE